MVDLPKGEPTEQEIRELTEMFPKFYPALRKKIEESRPKTHEDWIKFAKWHDDFINNMPSVKPMEEKPDSYFKFRMVRK